MVEEGPSDQNFHPGPRIKRPKITSVEGLIERDVARSRCRCWFRFSNLAPRRGYGDAVSAGVKPVEKSIFLKMAVWAERAISNAIEALVKKGTPPGREDHCRG